MASRRTLIGSNTGSAAPERSSVSRCRQRTQALYIRQSLCSSRSPEAASPHLTGAVEALMAKANGASVLELVPEPE